MSGLFTTLQFCFERLIIAIVLKCTPLILKGQCHKIFCFRFFSWIIFPQASKNTVTLGSLQIFLKILGQVAPPVSTTPVANLPPASPILMAKVPTTPAEKFCPWYCLCRWYWWKIMGTMSDCLHSKANLKKLIYMLTQTKYLKLLWLKIFSICHQCQRHLWCTLSC